MRKKPPRRIARETPGEKYYKVWLHGMRCICGCNDAVQQSHLRNMTGMARKENNFMSIPQCYFDHRDWTEATGRFAGMSKFERFGWFMYAIRTTHEAFEAQHGCKPEDYEPAARLRRVGEQP